MSWQRFEVALWTRLVAWTALSRRRDERGDVPGWVLVTLMTAGLVTILYAFAGDRLRELLADALSGIG